MKPTTQPLSHLVFANAQPRYVSMCFRSPSRQASRPDQPTQIGRIRYRLADSPTPSAGAAPQASYRRRPYHLRAIKTHKANFR